MICDVCCDECYPRGEVTQLDGGVVCYWCAFPRTVPEPNPPKEDE